MEVKTIIPLVELTKEQFIEIASNEKNYGNFNLHLLKNTGEAIDNLIERFEKNEPTKIMDFYSAIIKHPEYKPIHDRLFAWTCEVIKTCPLDTVRSVLSFMLCFVKASSKYCQYLLYQDHSLISSERRKFLSVLISRDEHREINPQERRTYISLINEEHVSFLNHLYRIEYERNHGKHDVSHNPYQLIKKHN